MPPINSIEKVLLIGHRAPCAVGRMWRQPTFARFIKVILMNILFNASQCGLGDNGGTKTIIRCAETLQDMGHRVQIYAKTNKYTWHKPGVTIKDNDWYGGNDEFTGAYCWDKEILVSVWEVEQNMKWHRDNLIDHRTRDFWYMRGWEKWVHGEDWLISQIKKFVSAGGRIIVNSSWLMDKLLRMGIDCALCYSGLDLDFWYVQKQKGWSYIGYLAKGKHGTKHYDICERIHNETALRTIELEPKLGYSELKSFYNNCMLWLAPTELEGFHQCLAEANLCGCLVVCNRMPSNGMGDYATDETAMRYDTWDELISCIENPDFSKVPLMQKVLREKIGNREENMRKFIKILED